MKMYRGVLLAGWVLTSLLAVAGFAAFSASSDDRPGSTTGEATVGTDVGRTAGAVSALAFTHVGDGVPRTVTTLDLDSALRETVDQRMAEGTSVTTSTTSRARTGGTRAATYIRSRYMTEPEIRDLISRYFRPEDVNRAVRIAWCESSFNPNSVNPASGASGLFQHLPQFWSERSAAAGFPDADIHDPEANVAVAAWLLYQAPGGWSHWTCTA